MVNWFYLSHDRRESAEMMCDEHIVKIPIEILQCAWIVVSVIDPALFAQALSENVVNNMIKKSYGGRLLHPLPRWMALCRGNYVESLLRCGAMLDVFRERFGHAHSLEWMLTWLTGHLPDFTKVQWTEWFVRERAGKDSKKRPLSGWFEAYACVERVSSSVNENESTRPFFISVEKVNRNGRAMTPFPQIMDDDDFPGCRTRPKAGCTPDDAAVEAGRKHYIMKAGGAVNGVKSSAAMKKPMRYLHSCPPKWLLDAGCVVQTQSLARLRGGLSTHRKSKTDRLLVKRPIRKDKINLSSISSFLLVR